jgi:hypothetical protein
VVCCGHGDGSEGKDKHDGEAGDGEGNGSRVRAEDVRSLFLFVVVVVVVCGGWWHSPASRVPYLDRYDMMCWLPRRTYLGTSRRRSDALASLLKKDHSLMYLGP